MDEMGALNWEGMGGMTGLYHGCLILCLVHSEV